MNKTSRFTVFEHESLHASQKGPFLYEHLEKLQRFHGEKGVPYYSLIHNGVRFCEYVGVLQLDNVVIEVLPKADRHSKEEWRNMLIDMLREVGVFDIHAPSASLLSLRPNSILDLYIKILIEEAETIVHKGLLKKYRKTEGNCTALKGSIVFAKQIQQNIVHRERFYTRYTIYSKNNIYNQILAKALYLLERINGNNALTSRIQFLLLEFSDISNIKITEEIFTALTYSRKTAPYQKAIQVAKLLLLNYHPDIQRGRNDVLSLMFDMNLLWEKFVYRSLVKYNVSHFTIRKQTQKRFWRKDTGVPVKLVPDIVVTKSEKEQFVIDTKWKNIGTRNPGHEDLRQMFAYSKYHHSATTALLYPGETSSVNQGHFYDEANNHQKAAPCNVITIQVRKDVNEWQKELSKQIFSVLKGQ